MLSLLAIVARGALVKTPSPPSSPATPANAPFQLISGAVVFGLSFSLSKRQQQGSVPPETGFSVFASTFGVSASLVGLASLWIESIRQGTILALGGVVTAAYLAAAVVSARQLSPGHGVLIRSDTWRES